VSSGWRKGYRSATLVSVGSVVCSIAARLRVAMIGILGDEGRYVLEAVLQPSEFYLLIQIFLGVSAAIVVVGGFMRWADRKLEARIVKEIKDSTYQIQPSSNGGASLSDLHKKVDGLIRDVGILKSSVLRLEGEVRTLEEDVEELR
jgi:hypothetical protein